MDIIKLKGKNADAIASADKYKRYYGDCNFEDIYFQNDVTFTKAKEICNQKITTKDVKDTFSKIVNNLFN